jgi:hypothetical protein
MRLILTAIILTMLAQPAWAKTSGQLFEDCKPWANNGFSFDGLTETQQLRAVACNSFQSGVIHLGFFACRDGDSATRLIFGNSIIKPSVMTQRFLNWAEANPELWEFTADPKNWIMGTCKE